MSSPYVNILTIVVDIVTAYFLNPLFRYSKHYVDDDEVRTGLKEVIKRLEPDVEKQVKAINEVYILQ